jgi:hypothetical protein
MPEKSKSETEKRDPPTDDCDDEKVERSYYYDDAHGYEDFDSDEDDEEFED